VTPLHCCSELRLGSGTCFVNDLATNDPGSSSNLRIVTERQQQQPAYELPDACCASDDDSIIDQMVEGMFNTAPPPRLI